ncbi:MAG: isoamylase early set domain-containing protein [Anaerolineales bacterium]
MRRSSPPRRPTYGRETESTRARTDKGGALVISKSYSKTGRPCRVTFRLPAEVHAQSACLCGSCNGWDRTSHPMTRRKDAGSTLTISLKPGQEYRFRYLLDGGRRKNDWAADSYSPNAWVGRTQWCAYEVRMRENAPGRGTAPSGFLRVGQAMMSVPWR